VRIVDRPHELTAREELQGGVDVPEGPVPVHERLDVGAAEEPPLDRRSLDDSPLRAVELVEAGGEKRLDRRGHHQLLVRPRAGVQREELLEEERVAVGRFDDGRDLRRA
jgi:hypothetical protein